MKKVVLASQSPNRKMILEQVGLKFEICPSDYEEDMTLKMLPIDLVRHLSEGKAKDVAKKYRNQDAVIIAAETIVAFENEVFGKPKTPEKAKELLSRLSGKAHSAITGFTIIDTNTGKAISKSVETKVYFKELLPEEIDAYIATGEPLQKAGAYGIQSMGALLVSKIDGDFTNIAGLPIFHVAEELKNFGIKII